VAGVIFSQDRQVTSPRTVWITFHWRGTISSVGQPATADRARAGSRNNDPLARQMGRQGCARRPLAGEALHGGAGRLVLGSDGVLAGLGFQLLELQLQLIEHLRPATVVNTVRLWCVLAAPQCARRTGFPIFWMRATGIGNSIAAQTPPFREQRDAIEYLIYLMAETQLVSSLCDYVIPHLSRFRERCGAGIPTKPSNTSGTTLALMDQSLRGWFLSNALDSCARLVVPRSGSQS